MEISFKKSTKREIPLFSSYFFFFFYSFFFVGVEEDPATK